MAAAPGCRAKVEASRPPPTTQAALDPVGVDDDSIEAPAPVPEPESDPVAEAEPAPEPEPEPEVAPEPMSYAALKDFHRGGVQLEVTRRVDTGLLPKSVEVSPDGKTIWVCNFGRVDLDNLWVYDAETLKKKAVIEFAGNAVETIWSPDQKTVYVSNFKRAVVEVIDAQSYKLKSEIKVGFNPKIMVATPDGKFLYVANWSSNDVTVIDLATGERVRRLKTGKHPRGMALHSDGRLFVNAMFSHQIHVFGDPPAKDGAAKVHKSCRYPRHSILSPDEQRLYVTCSGADKVYWYAPDGMKRTGWAKVGDNPRSMAMSDNGRFLAVADFDSSTLSLVDVREGTYDTFKLPGAKKVVGVALAPGDELVVYATSWLSGELIELRPVGRELEAAEPGPSAAAH